MGLLEFDDFGLSGEDDDICIDLINGYLVLPTLRGSDWVVPRLDGRIAGNRRKDTMIIPAAGIIKGVSLEDFNDNVTAVMAVLQPGQLDVKVLRLSDGYLGLDSGVTAEIEARCKNAAPGNVDSYRTRPIQKWTLEFEVITPEWTFGS